VRLDANRELQCTSCHNAHDNSFGRFLVMDNSRSQLCTTCHNQGPQGVAGHDTCNSCHKPHTAPSGSYLLRGRTVRDTCTTCHSGDPARPRGANVAAELNKLSRHDTNPSVAVRSHAPADVTCNDCHEPHTMQTGTAAAPALSPRLGAIDGVNASGVSIPRAQYQYEVCFKCHTSVSAVDPVVTRQVTQKDTRLEFEPSAVSAHPVEVAGRNSDVPSLRPGLTTGSLIYCTDCHASDAGTMTGAAAGPHGSNVRPLLRFTYDTADNTPETAGTYALCYSCHERASILSNSSFSGHSRHVVNARTPCSACHDAHGISSAQGSAMNHSHLMNFDTSIVRPDPVTGRLEFVDTGSRSGTCYLSCHGVPHSPKTYP
jgi:predicted CXXCH cytochrome family protein